MITVPARTTRAGPATRPRPWAAYAAAGWALLFALPTTGLTGITTVAAGERAEFLRLAPWFLFLWLHWFTLGATAWGALATRRAHRDQP
jgi:hypothetical protein